MRERNGKPFPHSDGVYDVPCQNNAIRRDESKMPLALALSLYHRIFRCTTFPGGYYKNTFCGRLDPISGGWG